VASHAKALPVDFQATDGALATTCSAIRKMSIDAETTITSGVEAVTDLGQVHKDAVRSMSEGISRAADSIVKASNAGVAVVAAHREAAAAEAIQLQARWGKTEELHQTSLVVFDDISGKTEAAAAECLARGQTAIQAEFSKGEATRESALSSLKKLAESVETGLLDVQATVQSGLAEEPLAAFKEDALPAIPERPQASMLPEGELLPPRPKVAALVAEFHRARSGTSKVLNNAENVGPALAAINDATKYTIKEAIGGKSTEKSARKVLGVLNRAD